MTGKHFATILAAVMIIAISVALTGCVNRPPPVYTCSNGMIAASAADCPTGDLGTAPTRPGVSASPIPLAPSQTPTPTINAEPPGGVQPEDPACNKNTWRDPRVVVTTDNNTYKTGQSVIINVANLGNTTYANLSIFLRSMRSPESTSILVGNLKPSQNFSYTWNPQFGTNEMRNTSGVNHAEQAPAGPYDMMLIGAYLSDKGYCYGFTLAGPQPIAEGSFVITADPTAVSTPAPILPITRPPLNNNTA